LSAAGSYESRYRRSIGSRETHRARPDGWVRLRPRRERPSHAPRETGGPIGESGTAQTDDHWAPLSGITSLPFRPGQRKRNHLREFGRLKNEWSPLPLRVRGIDRVRLHADLTILAKLACVLARARAV